MKAPLPILSALVAAVLLPGCATTVANWKAMDPGPKPDYETAKSQASELLSGLLKDPESAQFKNWTPFYKMLYNYGPLAAPEPLWGLCVDLNAKNSFGGYVGFKTYYIKFRDGAPVNTPELGYGVGSYECRQGEKDPGRQ